MTVYSRTILLWQHLIPCTTIYTTPYDYWRQCVWCHQWRHTSQQLHVPSTNGVHRESSLWQVPPPPVQYGHLMFRALVVIAPMCLSSTPSCPITLPLPFHTVLGWSSPSYLPAMVGVVDLVVCGLVEGGKWWCSLVARPNKKCLNVYDVINELEHARVTSATVSERTWTLVYIFFLSLKAKCILSDFRY